MVMDDSAVLQINSPDPVNSADKSRRRMSDARWRSNVSTCYETLKLIIPINKRACKRQIPKKVMDFIVKHQEIMNKHWHSYLYLVIIVTIVFLLTFIPKTTIIYNIKYARPLVYSQLSFLNHKEEDKICSHETRNQYLSQMCSTIKKRPFPSGGTRIIVDEKRKLMMCKISKSGCTSWKSIWLHSNMNPGKNLTKTTMKVKGQHVHIKNVTGKYGMVLVKGPKVPDRYSSANYTKFLVVRNPYDRLVSAYYNLINYRPGLGDGSYIFPFMRQKYPNLRRNISDLTFKQFLQYVTDPVARLRNDRHWVPYSQTCQPCIVHYDYIIRLETMSDLEHSDAIPILVMLNYDRSILNNYKKIQMNAMTRRDNQFRPSKWSKKLSLFHDIPPDLMDKVSTKYHLDLTLYGYNLSQDTSVANCEIQGEEGKCC